MYGKPRTWRAIWHFIWKKVDRDNSIKFDDLYNDPYVQQMLSDQFHNLGPDKTKQRFRDMFVDIKRQRGCCEEDEEFDMEDDGGGEDMVTESLRSRLHKQRRQGRQFEQIMESIIRRIR